MPSHIKVSPRIEPNSGGRQPESTSRTCQDHPSAPAIAASTWRALDTDPSVGGWLSGTIDDVTIFSRALSAGEVADLDVAPVKP